MYCGKRRNSNKKLYTLQVQISHNIKFSFKENGDCQKQTVIVRCSVPSWIQNHIKENEKTSINVRRTQSCQNLYDHRFLVSLTKRKPMVNIYRKRVKKWPFHSSTLCCKTKTFSQRVSVIVVFSKSMVVKILIPLLFYFIFFFFFVLLFFCFFCLFFDRCAGVSIVCFVFFCFLFLWERHVIQTL